MGKSTAHARTPNETACGLKPELAVPLIRIDGHSGHKLPNVLAAIDFDFFASPGAILPFAVGDASFKATLGAAKNGTLLRNFGMNG